MQNTTNRAESRLSNIEIARLSGENYRKLDEECVERLMASLRQHGQLQPIAVVESQSGYEVLFGFHRIEAAKRLAWQTIKAEVYPPTLDTADRIAIPIVENLQRNSGDRLELAIQVRRLAEQLGNNREAARRLGLSESWVCKLLKVLDFGEELSHLIREKKLAIRAAYALAGIKDAKKRAMLIEESIRRNLSVEQIEEILREQRKPATAIKRMCVKLGQFGSMTLAVSHEISPVELVKEIEASVKELRKLADGGNDLTDFVTLVAMQARKRGAF